VKRNGQFRDLFAPWAGLAVGMVAAGFVHQFGSEGVFDHCRPISPIPLLVVSVVGVIVTLAAAAISWPLLRKDSETHARKVIALISVGSAALFVLAMLLPMVAALVLPPCFQ
jgi:phosphoglycerol transferase MdoB-like AlkP superfamily enzyme